MRWADLDEGERRRVQRIYGIEVVNGQKVFGAKILTLLHLQHCKDVPPIRKIDMVIRFNFYSLCIVLYGFLELVGSKGIIS